MQHIGEYFTRGLAFAGIAIAMAACSPAKATNPQDGASPPPLVAISFPAEVHAGTSLPLTVTLTNPTPEPVSIALGGSATRIQFDIAVTAPDGGEVWRYALTDVGQASVTTLHTHVLAPGATITLAADWGLRTNDGVAVSPGTYRIRGIVFAAPTNLQTTHRELRIRP